MVVEGIFVSTERRTPPAGFPSEVTIGGERWKVWYYAGIYDKPNFDSAILGFASRRFRVILIDIAQPRYEVIDTLYHECAHIFIGQWRQKGKLNMDHELEEKLATLFGNAMLDFVQNNNTVR
jgi:hypothetical protein